MVVLITGATLSPEQRERPLSWLVVALGAMSMIAPITTLLVGGGGGSEAAPVLFGAVFCGLMTLLAVVPSFCTRGRKPRAP